MSKISKRLTRATRERKSWDRKFLGKIKDFKDDEEKIFQQKHLKAYIKGNSYFKHGTEQFLNQLGGMETRPKYHSVRQTLEMIPKSKDLFKNA